MSMENLPLWFFYVAPIGVLILIFFIMLICGRQRQNAKEEAQKLIDSNPTLYPVLKFLKKRTEEDEAVRIIRLSKSQACKEAIKLWEKWCSQEFLNKNAEIIYQLRAESQRYFKSFNFSHKRHGTQIYKEHVPILGSVQVIDYRSDQEKMIIKHVKAGISPGPIFDGYVSKILLIGRTMEFTVIRKNHTPVYDQHRRHKEVHRIGLLLNAAGGMSLMQVAAYRVRLSGGDGRDLDRCWNGIGEWRG